MIAILVYNIDGWFGSQFDADCRMRIAGCGLQMSDWQRSMQLRVTAIAIDTVNINSGM